MERPNHSQYLEYEKQWYLLPYLTDAVDQLIESFNQTEIYKKRHSVTRVRSTKGSIWRWARVYIEPTLRVHWCERFHEIADIFSSSSPRVKEAVITEDEGKSFFFLLIDRFWTFWVYSSFAYRFLTIIRCQCLCIYLEHGFTTSLFFGNHRFDYSGWIALLLSIFFTATCFRGWYHVKKVSWLW